MWDVTRRRSQLHKHFDNRTLIFPISLFYRHQIHQFEHYLSFSAIRRRPGRLRRQDLQCSCIKHSVCKTDFHSCFSPPKSTHWRGEQSAWSFNKPTSPPLEHWWDGSFHYFLAKDLGTDSKRRGLKKNLTGWYPSLLFSFLSEPFPHTLHGCLPERLLYYSSTLLPTSPHTLYILFDLCLMLLCSLKHPSAPFKAPLLLLFAHPVHIGNMSPPTCAHVCAASNNSACTCNNRNVTQHQTGKKLNITHFDLLDWLKFQCFGIFLLHDWEMQNSRGTRVIKKCFSTSC